MKPLKLCTFVLATLLPWAQAGAADGYRLEPQTYDVFGHGRLVMDVPREWQTEYVTYNDLTPPTLHVTDDRDPSFEMSVTVYWHDGLDRNLDSAEALRSLVEKVGRETLALSVQKQLKVEAIKGRRQPGFMFNLSDSNAREGEFHFVTQGAMAVGNLVLAFTLLTDQRPSAQWRACLDMLKSARHVPAHQSIGTTVVRSRAAPMAL